MFNVQRLTLPVHTRAADRNANEIRTSTDEYGQLRTSTDKAVAGGVGKHDRRTALTRTRATDTGKPHMTHHIAYPAYPAYPAYCRVRGPASA